LRRRRRRRRAERHGHPGHAHDVPFYDGGGLDLTFGVGRGQRQGRHQLGVSSHLHGCGGFIIISKNTGKWFSAVPLPPASGVEMELVRSLSEDASAILWLNGLQLPTAAIRSLHRPGGALCAERAVFRLTRAASF
jgi:hypothetical protein